MCTWFNPVQSSPQSKWSTSPIVPEIGCHKIVFSDILHFTGLEPKFYHRSIKWIVRMGYNIIEDYSLGITTALVKIVLSWRSRSCRHKTKEIFTFVALCCRIMSSRDSLQKHDLSRAAPCWRPCIVCPWRRSTSSRWPRCGHT